MSTVWDVMYKPVLVRFAGSYGRYAYLAPSYTEVGDNVMVTTRLSQLPKSATVVGLGDGGWDRGMRRCLSVRSPKP